MNTNNTPLSPRLMSVCGFVKQGSKIADIGTDHARVPIQLINSGVITEAIASDIGTGPLEKARENLEYFGLSDKVSLRLGNGLETVKHGEADCVIIAGMGGELISNILHTYIPEGVSNLILQPMTDAHFVRRALSDLGFTIVAEDIVAEKDKMYVVLNARPGTSPLTEEETYISPVLKKHPLFREYLEYRLKRMEKAAENAEKAGAQTQMVKEYNILKKENLK